MQSGFLPLSFTVLALLLTALPLPAQNKGDVPRGNESTADSEEFRDFTSMTGKTLRARVIKRIDDERFTLETPEGQSFVIKAGTLSETDRRYLEFWEPGAILDLATADLPDVLEKMGYGGANLISANNSFLVTATIGGRETKLVLDPGRAFSTLDPALAQQLGAKLVPGTVNVQDAAGNASRSQQASVGAIAIGESELERFTFQVIDMRRMFATLPANTQGAIGSDLLKKLNALLDYDGRRLYVRENGG